LLNWWPALAVTARNRKSPDSHRNQRRFRLTLTANQKRHWLAFILPSSQSIHLALKGPMHVQLQIAILFSV
ncbi:hypothetical protein, partial [Yersinia pestis]